MKLREEGDPTLAKGEPWPNEDRLFERGEATVALEFVDGMRRRSRSFHRRALRELLARMPVPKDGMGCDRQATLIRADSTTCPRCSKPVTHDNPRCACGECLGCHLERARG